MKYIFSSFLIVIFFFIPASLKSANASFDRHPREIIKNCPVFQSGFDNNNNDNCNLNTNTNNNSNIQIQSQSQGQIQNNNQEQNFNPDINNTNNNNITIGSYAPPPPQQSVVVQAAPIIKSLPSTGSPLSGTIIFLAMTPLGLFLRKLKKI